MSLPKGAIKGALTSDIIIKSPFAVFQMHPDDFRKITANPSHRDIPLGFNNTPLKGMQQSTLLSKVFFHPKNIDLIQKQIIMRVFHETDGTYLIEKQNEKDLKVIMRSMFIQYAKHSPDQIRSQIRQLNNLVVDEVVPDIVAEIHAYIGYLD